MQKKIIVLVLTLALTIMLFTPVAYSDGVGIPNPNTITYTTIGGPDSSCGTDPGGAYDTSSATLLQQVYEPLLMYNNISVQEFIPMLSDSWPGYNWTGYATPGNWIVPLHPTNVTENATLNALGIKPPTLHIRYLGDIPTEEVWVFHIRKGVPWQNSLYGYLTPSDFVYTIQRDIAHGLSNHWRAMADLLAAVRRNVWQLSKCSLANQGVYCRQWHIFR